MDTTVPGVSEVESTIGKSWLLEMSNFAEGTRDEIMVTCIMPLISGLPGTLTAGFQTLAKLPALPRYWTYCVSTQVLGDMKYQPSSDHPSFLAPSPLVQSQSH